MFMVLDQEQQTHLTAKSCPQEGQYTCRYRCCSCDHQPYSSSQTCLQQTQDNVDTKSILERFLESLFCPQSLSDYMHNPQMLKAEVQSPMQVVRHGMF